MGWMRWDREGTCRRRKENSALIEMMESCLGSYLGEARRWEKKRPRPGKSQEILLDTVEAERWIASMPFAPGGERGQAGVQWATAIE